MEHTSLHQKKHSKQEAKEGEAAIMSANKTSTSVPETPRSKTGVGITT
jgi:hypothetical protein